MYKQLHHRALSGRNRFSEPQKPCRFIKSLFVEGSQDMKDIISGCEIKVMISLALYQPHIIYLPGIKEAPARSQLLLITTSRGLHLCCEHWDGCGRLSANKGGAVMKFQDFWQLMANRHFSWLVINCDRCVLHQNWDDSYADWQHHISSLDRISIIRTQLSTLGMKVIKLSLRLMSIQFGF